MDTTQSESGVSVHAAARARYRVYELCLRAYLPNSGYQHADHKFTPVIFVHCEQRQLHKPIICFIDAFCFTLFSRRGELYQFSFMKNGGFNIYVSEYATLNVCGF